MTFLLKVIQHIVARLFPAIRKNLKKLELGRLAFLSCPTGPAGKGWSSISTSGCWGRLYSRQRSQMSFFNCCKSWKRRSTNRHLDKPVDITGAATKQFHHTGTWMYFQCDIFPIQMLLYRSQITFIHITPMITNRLCA